MDAHDEMSIRAASALHVSPVPAATPELIAAPTPAPPRRKPEINDRSPVFRCHLDGVPTEAGFRRAAIERYRAGRASRQIIRALCGNPAQDDEWNSRCTKAVNDVFATERSTANLAFRSIRGSSVMTESTSYDVQWQSTLRNGCRGAR
jgi:hypothetical protein